MAQKRKLDEFTDDLAKSSAPVDVLPDRSANNDAPHNHSVLKSPMMANTQVASTKPLETVSAVSKAASWEVALSKKSKKRKKKKFAEQEDENALPHIKFSSPVSSPLRIKELQSLILYILADGVAPQWVAIQQSKKIDQLVTLMVPGMDKHLLESFVKSAAARKASDSPDVTSQSRDDNMDHHNGFPDGVTGAEASAVQHSSLPAPAPPGLHIVPVRAPGDRKTGRLSSPIQAMLISPEPKQNDNINRRQDAFRPVKTSLADLVHSADELVLAEYPVHPASFANSKDADLENERRRAAKQSSADGWVDTHVFHPTPQLSGNPNRLSPLDQGLQVYAMDCEMVLTTDERYSLARISVLDWLGKPILDKHVRPSLPIKDYFTQFSGITPESLEGVNTSLEDIQKELLALLSSSSVLVGHSLESDLNALKLTHPFLVDTALLYPHPRGLPFRSSLKFLANKYLKREIQKGANGHDSVEDARAALDLVRLKHEKGPRFGVVDAYGESIFARLARAGRASAMVDYGVAEKGFGLHASIKTACQNDDDITKGVQSALSRGEVGSDKLAFIWGRLRDLETARGWDSNRDRYTDLIAASEVDARTNRLHDAKRSTTARLRSIYDSLPASTLLIVYPGPGDMREVQRLQNMHREYQREFKVKKWDELSVQWTDNEEQALRKAFEVARQGWALVGIK